MARITVEDCLQHVKSPFALVHAAVRRARQLQLGSKALVQRPEEKPTVTALREIAAGLIEQIPLADQEQEETQQDPITEEEEFAKLLESPDFNVQLGLPPEELEEQESKKKPATKKKTADDDFDDFDD